LKTNEELGKKGIFILFFVVLRLIAAKPVVKVKVWVFFTNSHILHGLWSKVSVFVIFEGFIPKFLVFNSSIIAVNPWYNAFTNLGTVHLKISFPHDIL
jgi:hypothetical protein